MVTDVAVPRLVDALTATSCSVLIIDFSPDSRIVAASKGFTALYGYTAAEVISCSLRLFLGPDTDTRTNSQIEQAMAAGVGIQREVLHYRKDGTSFWTELTIDPIPDPAGGISGFISVQREADALHRAIAERAEAEAKLDSIVGHVPGFVYRRIMRTDGTIDVGHCSPALAKMLEIDQQTALPALYDYVHPDDRDALLAAIRQSAADLSPCRLDYRLVSASGVVHWLRSNAPPRRLPNGELVWDGLALDIGAERRWQSEIAVLALRDPLTKLLTREAWSQSVVTHVGDRSGGAHWCGLLYFDVAGFRNLNSTVGKSAGDEVLREIARRLAAIASVEAAVVARLGGDEFAMLLPACETEAALSRIACSTADALARPFQIGGQQKAVRLRIGASLSAGRRGDDDLSDRDIATELEVQAEIALRWAKRVGASGAVRYAPAQDDRLQNQGQLAASLEAAIMGGQLELHYQPLVDLASGRIVAAEALVRWNHPELGLQRPDLFIPLAEKMGLIDQLGRWVLLQALRQRKLWQGAGLSPPPIAINVSGNQLSDAGFVTTVEQVLIETGACAADFELELTEGLLIEPSPQVLASLHALRAMGFKIAIDDFGSGHATFRYLRDFPVDKLKIDQIFVRKLVLESTDALIIRAVLTLARSMGIAFVAEGIETEMQREFLLREGCETGQGYLFSMPLVAEDFAWMLENDVRLPRQAPAELHAAQVEPDYQRVKGMHAR